MVLTEQESIVPKPKREAVQKKKKGGGREIPEGTEETKTYDTEINSA